MKAHEHRRYHPEALFALRVQGGTAAALPSSLPVQPWSCSPDQTKRYGKWGELSWWLPCVCISWKPCCLHCGLASETTARFLCPHVPSKKGCRRFWCQIARPGMLLSGGEMRWSSRFYPSKCADDLEVGESRDEGSRKKRGAGAVNCELLFFFF